MRGFGVLLACVVGTLLPVPVMPHQTPSSGSTIRVWAAPDGFKVDRSGTRIFVLDVRQRLSDLTRSNRLWDSQAQRVTLHGARGETIAFQLGIEGGTLGLAGVNVLASSLANRTGASIPSTQVQLFKVYYTELRDRGSGPTNGPTMGKGWYPDALVPWSVRDTRSYGGYDGPPFAVRPGEIQGVWVDLTIPYGTPAGDYTGALTVQAADHPALVLRLAIRVLDFDIPRKIHNTFFMNFSMADLNQAGGRWLTDDTLAAYEDEVYRLARRHRFTAGNMYSQEMPGFEETSKGDLAHVDWRDYDAAFGKVLSPTRNLFGPGEDAIEIWKVPLFTGINSGFGMMPKGDRAWDQMAAEIVRHWREKGWDLARAYVYLADEPEPSSLAALSEFAARVKKASGGALRRQIALNAGTLGYEWRTQRPVFDRLKDNVDMWLVSGSNYSTAQMKTLPPGAFKGMYQGGEPYQGNETLDADGVALRTWSWIAWQYRLDYQCYYSMSEAYNKAVPDPSNPDRFIYEAGAGRYNNDNEIWDHPRTRPWGVSQGVFIYPGKKVGYDMPIVNIRMKQIRRGQTDFEYFWLLQQAGEGALADQLVKGVLNVALSEAADRPEWFGYGKWSHNPEDWDAAVANAAARLEEVKDRLPKERPARPSR